MVPIPEGVERHDEEPDNENYAHDIEQSDMAQSDGGGSTREGSGNGKGSSGSERVDMFDGMRG